MTQAQFIAVGFLIAFSTLLIIALSGILITYIRDSRQRREEKEE